MMTQHLAYRWTYEVPPLRTFQIRNRLDYLSEKSRRLDQYDLRVLELRERAGLFRCVTRMDLEVVLPGWARHLFKPRNTVTQHEIWHPAETDGSRVCDLTVEVGSVPVKVTGSGRLVPVSPDGFTVTGTDYELEVEVSSRMPVFGRRLEEFVATQVDRNAQGEGDFGHWWYTHRELPERSRTAQGWGL
jgi:uncharacterized protein DUF2505